MKTSTIRRLAFLGIFIPFLCACSDDSQSPEEEEPKPNYITVVVKTTGICHGQDDQGHIHAIPNLTVKVDIIKASGRTISFEAPTSETGQFQGPDAVFELYRQQPITCSGTVIGGLDDLPYVFSRKTLTLTWQQVSSVKDFGETYTWKPHLIIFGST